MRLLLLCLAVCLASTFGQTPPVGSGATPTKPAATKTPSTPAIAPALEIVPAKTASPRGSPNLPPPRASPPSNRGRGIFNAPVQSPWGIPPPQQPWGMPQYPPPSASSGFQQNTRWGAQSQPNPFQSLPWLRMQNMNVLLDRMDVPCGMSRRRQQMFMHAVDHPDPFCECRIGGCDGGVFDFTGQTECGAFGASCCCTGTPYSGLVTATLLSNSLASQGQGAFNPYQRNRMGMQPQGMGMLPPAMSMQRQAYAPNPVPSPMLMSQAQRQQPTNVQDFRSLWFR